MATFFDIGVETDGVESTRIGLIVTSLQIEKETYLYTTKVARFAGEVMRDLIPEGYTGNLKRAVKADIVATPFRETTGTGRFGGGGWQARAYIDNRGLAFYTGRRPIAPGAAKRGPQDPPIEYVLALNDGRQAMVAGQFGKKKFAWYDPERPPNVYRQGPKAGQNKSPYGYNVFKGALRARPGIHFIERTQVATESYALQQTRDFLRRKGKSTISSRSADRFSLGIFQGDPSNLPV